MCGGGGVCSVYGVLMVALWLVIMFFMVGFMVIFMVVFFLNVNCGFACIGMYAVHNA